MPKHRIPKPLNILDFTATSLAGFDAYMQSGDSTKLNDISLDQLKLGDEFIIANRGWNWTVRVVE